MRAPAREEGRVTEYLPKKTMRTLSELAAGRIEIVTGADARAVLLLVATAEQLERDVADARKKIAGHTLENNALRTQVAIEEARAVRAEHTTTKLRKFAARTVLERNVALAEVQVHKTRSTTAQPGDTKE